jgi:hypothetical protein
VEESGEWVDIVSVEWRGGRSDVLGRRTIW